MRAMSRRKGTYVRDPALHVEQPGYAGASALYVGYKDDSPPPPRWLCRSCVKEPYPPEGGFSSCKSGFMPKEDGSCRFYARDPGSDDE